MRKLTLVLTLAAVMPLAAAAPISQQDRDVLIKDLENVPALHF